MPSTRAGLLCTPAVQSRLIIVVIRILLHPIPCASEQLVCFSNHCCMLSRGLYRAAYSNSQVPLQALRGVRAVPLSPAACSALHLSTLNFTCHHSGWGLMQPQGSSNSISGPPDCLGLSSDVCPELLLELQRPHCYFWHTSLRLPSTSLPTRAALRAEAQQLSEPWPGRQAVCRRACAHWLPLPCPEWEEISSFPAPLVSLQLGQER